MCGSSSEDDRKGEPFETGNGIAVAEPLVVHLEQDEPVRQGFIEIIDIKSGRRVVTVIEILSPSNKLPGPGRELYLKKQDELRAGCQPGRNRPDPNRHARFVVPPRPHSRRPSHAVRRLCPPGLETFRDRVLPHPPP